MNTQQSTPDNNNVAENEAEKQPVVEKKIPKSPSKKKNPAKKKLAPKKPQPSPEKSAQTPSHKVPVPSIQENPSEAPIVRDTPLPSKAPTPIRRSEEITTILPPQEASKQPQQEASKLEPANKVETSQAEKIWQSVQGRRLEMFGLPNQFVSMFCQFVPVDQNRCFLKYKIAAVLPALEIASPEFNVEAVQGYIVLSKKTPALW